jgi:hypothetical protein
MKILRLKGLLFFLLTISILCVALLLASYGKTSRQTSFNTDSRQPSVDLSSNSSSDSQNSQATAHKEFNVESWLKKIKTSALNSGIFSRYDVSGALYAQNGEPRLAGVSCDGYYPTSTTMCWEQNDPVYTKMYMTDSSNTIEKDTFKFNETPFLYTDPVSTNTKWFAPDKSYPEDQIPLNNLVTLSIWDSVKKEGKWNVEASIQTTGTRICVTCPVGTTTYEDLGSHEISSSISFTVTNIEVSPTSHDFGNVDVNSTSPPQEKTFTVSNIGNKNIALGTIALSGTNKDEFIIQNDNCSRTNLTPKGTPSDYCEFKIVFEPTSKGAKPASLDIPSNAYPPNLNVRLDGASGNSNISGTVYDKSTGEKIPGASVQIGTYPAATTSSEEGSKGTYSISNVKPGTYTATVIKDGYPTLNKDVTIPPDNINVINNFYLSPCSGTPQITSISSKYPDGTFFLDGVDHYVEWTVNVDWAGQEPGMVKFITQKGTYDPDTTTTTQSPTPSPCATTSSVATTSSDTITSYLTKAKKVFNTGFGLGIDINALGVELYNSGGSLLKREWTENGVMPKSYPDLTYNIIGENSILSYKSERKTFSLWDGQENLFTADIPIVGSITAKFKSIATVSATQDSNRYFSIHTDPSAESNTSLIITNGDETRRCQVFS